MLKRECMHCGKLMDVGKPFFKVCRSVMFHKNQKLKHIGDLCPCCIKMIKGGKQ